MKALVTNDRVDCADADDRPLRSMLDRFDVAVEILGLGPDGRAELRAVDGSRAEAEPDLCV